MSKGVSRRRFIAGLGAIAASASTAEVFLLKPLARESCAFTSFPATSTAWTAQQIKIGYAAITWGGNDLEAIKDVSDLGFKGIQLRANILQSFGERPKELRAVLDQHKLELVAFSSGGVRISAATEAEEIAKHTKHATFVRDVGGKYLQVTDSARSRDRKPAPDDFKQLGRILTEIGKRTSDLGIPVGYHNHMHSLGESPDEVDRIMDAVDPRFIKLELDIAHYQQGGGDPIKAIRKYRDRLLFLHIKDVETVSTEVSGNTDRPYRFVELGRGRVDLPGVFKELKAVKFDGWAVIELDSVPDKTRTPKESAAISKRYVEEKLGLKIA